MVYKYLKSPVLLTSFLFFAGIILFFICVIFIISNNYLCYFYCYYYIYSFLVSLVINYYLSLSLLIAFILFETLCIIRNNTVELQGLEHCLPVYYGCFEFVLESRGKNPIAADLEHFNMFFFYILKMVYCVYSLESPR